MKNLSGIGLGVLLTLVGAVARGDSGTWSLAQAEQLSVALLKVQKQGHFIGHFRDRAFSSRHFDAFEGALNEYLPHGPHRLRQFEATPEGLKLWVRVGGQEKVTLLQITFADEKTTAPKSQSAETTQSTRMAETLGLTINDTVSNQSMDKMRFVSLTQGRTATAFDPDLLNGQVEGGIRFKRFTVSVFSRQLLFGTFNQRILNQNGVAITLPLAQIGGFQFDLRVEAAHAVDSKIVYSAGVAHVNRDSALNTQMRLELSRSFGLSGVSVGEGVKFIYFGANGLDQEPLKVAFLRLSKAINNRRGDEVASVHLLATEDLGRADHPFMVSIVGSFKF